MRNKLHNQGECEMSVLRHVDTAPCSHVLPVLLYLLLFLALPAWGQNLRYSNRREVAIPEYATVRIGPFYSTMLFSQTAGYRYTRSSGAGTDYLTANRRGAILKDGEEFPLVSRLDFRNYLLITRNIDLDMSVRVGYEYYPLKTQENEFFIDLPEDGIGGNLSMEIALTPYIKGTLYERALYRTDYLDDRGMTDYAGGQEYEYFRNTAGMNLDWLMAKDKNLGISVRRLDLQTFDDEFERQDRVTWSESIII